MADEARQISREQMFPLLIKADPTFDPVWRNFVMEWGDEPDPPLYRALSYLARHLVRRLEHNETGGFDAVFDVVELWLVRGDPFVQEAASIGLLESLQNTNLYSRTKPADFEEWLRPESQRWWIKVERFWSSGEPMTDI